MLFVEDFIFINYEKIILLLEKIGFILYSNNTWSYKDYIFQITHDMNGFNNINYFYNDSFILKKYINATDFFHKKNKYKGLKLNNITFNVIDNDDIYEYLLFEKYIQYYDFRKEISEERIDVIDSLIKNIFLIELRKIKINNLINGK